MTLVQDLLKKALDTNISTSDLLRNAYTVAFKLNIPDLKQWINNELNGYKDANDLPDYRFVKGFMRSYNPYHGWQDVTIKDKKLIRALEHLPIVDKISAIEQFTESKEEIRNLPNSMPKRRKFYRMKNFKKIGRILCRKF